MNSRVWWAAALAVGLLVVGCNTQNVEPPQSKEQAQATAEAPAAAAPSGPTEMPPGHPPISKMPSEMPQMEAGPTITGTISLSPELADKASPEAVLYIIARQEGMRAPIAVARLQKVTFPAAYSLESQHMMGAPPPPEGKVEVVARLDKDGFVGPPQPGDIEGTYPKTVSMGDADVNITLDKLIK